MNLRGFIMRFFFFLLVFLTTGTLFFSSCKNNTPPQPLNREQRAQLVSELPAHILAPDAPLTIRFVDAVVSDTSQKPSPGILQTTPSASFRLRWKDTQTLQAIPLEPFAPGTDYKASLNLNKLAGGHFKDKKTLSFDFRTLSQEVTAFHGDFEPQKADNPSNVLYKGRISLLIKTTLKAVKNAFSLSEAGRNLTIDIQALPGGKDFSFTSPPLKRTKNDRHFLARINAETLQMEKDFRYDVLLPGISRFKVTQITSGGDETNPRLKIIFSDEPAAGQDIRGLVTINPHLPLKLKKSAKTIFINAAFEHGKSYEITVHKGIRSKWGTQLKTDRREKVTFENIQPQIRFSGSGVILPSDNEQKITFMCVNVRRVHLQILRVFESNIGQFLQMENLDGNSRRRNEFSYQIDRVGISIADTNLFISGAVNRWLQNAVDIKKLIKNDDKGFLLVHLSFDKKDMIYSKPAHDKSYENYRRSHRRRYGEVGSYWYMYNMANVYKPVIISDIGLTLKTGPHDTRVFATDLISGEPLPKVHIILRSYQNQIIAELETDSKGMARFYDVKGNIFYVEGIHENQHSIIKTNEMAWNLSSFDIGGTRPAKDGYKAYIYNDRGVYRPGDTAHVSIVLRDRTGSIPDGLPVSLKMQNPRGQTVLKTVNKEGRDGFYSFTVSTATTDPTGLYRLHFKAGASSFNHVLRVETIAPERIKVKVSATPEVITAQTPKLELSVNSRYLFGTPAAGLQVRAHVTVKSIPTHFKSFKDFIFSSSLTTFQGIDDLIDMGYLNADGKFVFKWKPTQISGAPGILRALFKVSVREKGGRKVKRQLALPFYAHQRYVGYRPLKLEWNAARLNEPLIIPAVMVDIHGKPLTGKTIHYSIYRNHSNWWWEYDSRDRFRMRFKKAENSVLVTEGNLISGSRPVNLNFTPEEAGEYLIEFSDPQKDGHRVQYFFSAGFYGGGNRARDAGDLVLHSDKKEYKPGDEAVVSFPMPQEAIALITVEKGGKILETHWHYPGKGVLKQQLKIKVTGAMQPTAYVSVSVIQPHKATVTDRPLRSYGVIPLNVHDPEAREGIRVNMPETLKPGQSFKIHLQTVDNQPAQFTVALVDEGLLQLTRFKSPDPLKWFFRKERLLMHTYDLYGKVLGVNHGDIFKTFSIGGDMAMMALRAPDSGAKNKSIRRFKPVAFFAGPLTSDAGGKLTVPITLPEYVGELRLMVVAVNKNRFGKLEKHVPVKSDLMVLPTAPRVLGPGDADTLPVTVFATRSFSKPVKVSIHTDGPLQIVGAAEKSIVFKKPGERDLFFSVKGKAAIGPAQIRISAQSGNASAHYKADLPVRASAQQEYVTQRKESVPGGALQINVPPSGISGSSKARLTLRLTPDMNLGARLFELIHYPYGCIEQTVSSVMPQLYIRRFIAPSELADDDITHNINRAIRRLRKFSLRSGAFSYWPGQSTFSAWGTNYAGHFMIEARKHGYYVPDDLFNDWLRFQQSRALLSTEDMTTRAYRLYLLALAGKPAIGPMNLIREGHLHELNNTQRWLLGAAYQLAGNTDDAAMIISEAGITITKKGYDFRTYGSPERDKALILQQAVLFGKWQKADPLARELITLMRSDAWLSTQEKAFILMGLARYQTALTGKGNGPLKLQGSIVFEDGTKQSFDTDKPFVTMDVDRAMDSNIRVRFSKNCTSKRLFATLEWNGIPLTGRQKDTAQNLSLKVSWLDEDGHPLNPAKLKQGQTIWGLFQVGLSAKRGRLNDLALTQILPSGWEIDLDLGPYSQWPSWSRRLNPGNGSFKDIRDDRINWFFNLQGGRAKNFMVKINVVSAGHFFLPGAQAQAMYDHSYLATKAGQWVDVQKAGVKP